MNPLATSTSQEEIAKIGGDGHVAVAGKEARDGDAGQVGVAG